jgi:hypothetical protein
VHSTSGDLDEGLKRARGDYRGRATDSGQRGEAHYIPAVARPQAQPQMINNMRDRRRSYCARKGRRNWQGPVEPSLRLFHQFHRSLCFANIPTAVRITRQTCTSRPERRCFGPDEVNDLTAQRQTQNCDGDPAPSERMVPDCSLAYLASSTVCSVNNICRAIGQSHLRFEPQFPTEHEWPRTSLGIFRDAESCWMTCELMAFLGDRRAREGGICHVPCDRRYGRQSA